MLTVFVKPLELVYGHIITTKSLYCKQTSRACIEIYSVGSKKSAMCVLFTVIELSTWKQLASIKSKWKHVGSHIELSSGSNNGQMRYFNRFVVFVMVISCDSFQNVLL